MWSEPENVELRDGSRVTIRAVAPSDEAALRSFLEGLCAQARYLRFFSGAADTAGAAHDASETATGRFGLLARDEQGAVVAHALYLALDDSRAEVAVEVADHLHDYGLGTILIERLASVAERNGIASFVAEVLPANRAMLDVFRHGFDASVALRSGVDMVEFPTSAWRTASDRFLTSGQ
jgi:hypothetical protein